MKRARKRGVTGSNPRATQRQHAPADAAVAVVLTTPPLGRWRRQPREHLQPSPRQLLDCFAEHGVHPCEPEAALGRYGARTGPGENAVQARARELPAVPGCWGAAPSFQDLRIRAPCFSSQLGPSCKRRPLPSAASARRQHTRAPCAAHGWAQTCCFFCGFTHTRAKASCWARSSLCSGWARGAASVRRAGCRGRVRKAGVGGARLNCVAQRAPAGEAHDAP